MIITPKIQGTGVQVSIARRSAPWAFALVAGSIFLACSGTIETPSEEFPRRSNRSANANDDDDGASANPPARQTADTPQRTPAGNDDDEQEQNDPPPTASAGDDDEPAASPEPPEEPEDEPPATTTLAFEDDIWPIFNSACGPCHVSSGLGGNNIGNTDVDASFEDASRVGERVMVRIDAGEMPPGCAGGAPGDLGCVTEADYADLEEWYAAGAPE